MKKLQLITAAAGILVALCGTSFAATRHHHTVNGASAYARQYDPSYGSVGDSRPWPYNYGSYQGNLPYPDRPYGDPDRP